MIGILFIFIACILWALDTLIRYPLLFSGLSPWSIVWLEHLVLVVLMLIWIVPLVRKRLFKSGHFLPFLIIGGLGSALSTVAFTNAFSLINPSVVILIQKLQPVVAITLAAWLLGERVDRQFSFWLLACLLGSVLIASADLQPALQAANWVGPEMKTLLWGYGCTLLAVVGWGSATVFGKQLSNKGFSTAELMAGRFTVGFLVLTPFAFLLASPLTMAESNAALSFLGTEFSQRIPVWIVLMVLISGLAGMGFYYLGMKRIPARVCAIAEMLFPIAAVVINWVFLDKTLTSVQLLGMAILLFASTMIGMTQSRQEASSAPQSAVSNA